MATTFAELKFNDRDGHPMGEQAKVFFANGYGASVVRGPHSYGGPGGLFELAVLLGGPEAFSLTYDTPVTDDVLGYLRPEDVTAALLAIEALPAQPRDEQVPDDGSRDDLTASA